MPRVIDESTSKSAKYENGIVTAEELGEFFDFHPNSIYLKTLSGTHTSVDGAFHLINQTYRIFGIRNENELTSQNSRIIRPTLGRREKTKDSDREPPRRKSSEDNKKDIFDRIFQSIDSIDPDSRRPERDRPPRVKRSEDNKKDRSDRPLRLDRDDVRRESSRESDRRERSNRNSDRTDFKKHSNEEMPVKSIEKVENSKVDTLVAIFSELDRSYLSMILAQHGNDLEEAANAIGSRTFFEPEQLNDETLSKRLLDKGISPNNLSRQQMISKLKTRDQSHLFSFANDCLSDSEESPKFPQPIGNSFCEDNDSQEEEEEEEEDSEEFENFNFDFQNYVKISQVKTTCPICFEEFTREDMYTVDCGQHSFCFECIQNYVKQKIKEKEAPFKCPQCTHVMTTEVQALDKDLYIKYEEILNEKTIEKMNDVIKCPTPNCKGVYVRSSTDRERVQCDICRFEFCSDCKRMYHFRTQCSQIENLLQDHEKRQKQKGIRVSKLKKKEIEERRSSLVIEKETTPCPKCRAPIGKDEGCNHMTCSFCKHEFCWLCLNSYTRSKLRGLTHEGECNASERAIKANKIREEWEKEAQETQQVKLTDAKCDECQVQLSGDYFECINCPAFWICESCELKTQHDEEHILKEVKTGVRVANAHISKPARRKPTVPVVQKFRGPHPVQKNSLPPEFNNIGFR